MKTYKVKPITGTEVKYIDFSELYIAPDLSFISGVTDYTTGLVNGEKVIVKSKIKKGDVEVPDNIVLPITVNNVQRQGKVEVEVWIPIKTITKVVNLPLQYDNGTTFVYRNNKREDINQNDLDETSNYEYSAVSVTQKYVEYNGNISYFFNKEDNRSGFLINDRFYDCSDTEKFLKLRSYLYIEDDKFVVGELEYDVNMNYSKIIERVTESGVCGESINTAKTTYEMSAPSIQYSKYNEEVRQGDTLGIIDGCIIKKGENIYDYHPTQWSRIQKFTIGNDPMPNIVMDDVLRGGYIHFIMKDGQRYELSMIEMGSEKRPWIESDEDKQPFMYGTYIDNELYVMSDSFTSVDDKELFYRYHDTSLSDEFVLYPYYNSGEPEHDKDGFDDPEFVAPVTYPIQQALRALTNDGNFLILISKSETLSLIEGNTIIAKSINPIKRKCYLQFDDPDPNAGVNMHPYIVFNGNRYDVDADLYDTIEIAGERLRLEYGDDKSKARVKLTSGDVVEYTKNSDTVAKGVNRIYYLGKPGTKVKDEVVEEADDVIRFGVKYDGYEVTKNSGVTIDDNVYMVQYEYVVQPKQIEVDGELQYVESDEDYESATLYYVEIDDMPEYELDIFQVVGSSTYLCNPRVSYEFLNATESDNAARSIVREIADNGQSFVFRWKNKTFGDSMLNPDVKLLESMHTDFPIAISDRKDVYDSLKIGKLYGNLSFDIPLETKVTNKLFAEDVIKNHFIEYMSQNTINEVVDMEKDVYYPVIFSQQPSDSNDCNTISYKMASEVRFNLHFRTRNLDNWKVYDEYNSSDPNMCNWFITDYRYYTEAGGGKNNKIAESRLQSASDLVGFMNFTTSEVKNQAKKIGRSFLRVSYYSTNDPQTQVLLGTSVIYLDEAALLKKYLSLNTSGMIAFCSLDRYQVDNSSAKKSDWSTIECEALGEVLGNTDLSDDLRLSSRLTVSDKYNTDNSAEGYYMYMFKEYSKKGIINTIYARFEFNHAGIGQSIPMMIPRKNIGTEGEDLLLLSSEDDLNTLKEGFEMKNIYKQMFFPIHVMYDVNTNKYIYWMNPIISNKNANFGTPRDVMEFNLFEIKFKDESVNENNK